MDNLSLSDIKAAIGNEDNGTGAWWIILLFIVMFGGGNFFGARDNYATAASQQEILFGQNFQNLDNKIDRLGNGIADATFALNNTITNEGRNLNDNMTAGFMDMQKCCCDTQRSIDGVKYEGAINTAAINANIDAKFAALEKGQLEQRIATQEDQIRQLQLNAAMCGVIKYPNAATYTAGPYPFTPCCGGTTF